MWSYLQNFLKKLRARIGRCLIKSSDREKGRKCNKNRCLSRIRKVVVLWDKTPLSKALAMSLQTAQRETRFFLLNISIFPQYAVQFLCHSFHGFLKKLGIVKQFCKGIEIVQPALRSDLFEFSGNRLLTNISAIVSLT